MGGFVGGPCRRVSRPRAPGATRLTTRVRPALLAGRWYPAGAEACRRAISELAPAAAVRKGGPGRVLGVVAPHAGWAYSGALAREAIAALPSDADLVVVFGSHLPPTAPPRVWDADAAETPLGKLPISPRATAEVRRALPSCEVETAARPRPDNAVEVLLPLLAERYGEIPIVVAGIPPTDAAVEAGRRVAEIAGEAAERPVFIGSTDLTHYGPSFDFVPAGPGENGFAWAREADRRFLDALEETNGAEALRRAEAERSACCPGAAVAALAAAVRLGARSGRILSHWTSRDVTGSAPDAVGYGGVAWSA